MIDQGPQIPARDESSFTVRRCAAAVLLLVMAAGIVLSLVLTHDIQQPALDLLLDRATHLLLLASVLVVAVGLFVRAFWARWAACGLSIGGLVQTAVMYPIGGSFWFIICAPVAATLIGILVLLGGTRMGDRFERAPSSRNRWNLSIREVRVLSWALVLNIGAVPMLAFYLGSDAPWIGPGRRLLTAALLALLVAALVLVVLQRTAGLLLLGISGLLMIGLAADAALGALRPYPPELDIPGCSLTPRQALLLGSLPAMAASVPGGVAAVAALAAFRQRLADFLRH